MEPVSAASAGPNASLLAAVPAFHGFNREDFEALAPRVTTLHCPTGTVIIREGEMGDAMFLVRSGRVRVSKRGAGDSEVPLDELGAGAYFGEFSLIDRLPRSADVRAIEAAEVLELRRSAFEAFLASDARRAAVFYRNCLGETFQRFRHLSSNFTFSEHVLRQTSGELKELQGDMAKARQLQEFFLHPSLVAGDARFGGLEARAIFKPCQEVGGDFLDVVERHDGSVAFFIADVCGHGVTGAIATGILKSAFSHFAKDPALSAAALLTRLNAHASGLLSDLYATAWLSIWNPSERSLTFAKAGHPTPFVWREQVEKFECVEMRGVCLGFDANAQFSETQLILQPGDLVLLYTDGIPEQENSGGQAYGEERLMAFMKAHLRGTGPKPLSALLTDLEAWAGRARFTDDVAALLLRA